MSDIGNTGFVFINDSFVLEGKAMVSVRDRGFRFGDGVFETIRVESGKIKHIKIHLKRLKGGLKALKIDFDISGLNDICEEISRKNKIENGFLRIAISRGEGSVGYLPNEGIKPTLVVETVNGLPEIDEQVDLWISSYRKIPDICLPSNAKTAQGLNSTLARMEAREKGCFEALLLSVEGHICEGSSANIFWFKNNKLYTPKNNVLPGTVRELIIKNSPYEVVLGDFAIDELKDASEVFLTNVAWQVASVKKLKPLGYKWEKHNVANEIRAIL